ncbi:MAG: 1-acyl-sn-glycerol-3-phosphate acyltransferase [Clostridia bacterium]|nr:1-acyl-sn-glycerol-3-phosphate acyltransferase [Clostridia bacterium]
MNSKNLFANTLLFLGTPILYILHPFKFYGAENLPKGGGFIIASNHIFWLDAFYIALCSKKSVHFMAKSELFRYPFFNWFFRSLKAFPVKRGYFDRQALKTATEIIDSGEVLGIFPEGGIVTPDGKPTKAKWGVAYIAGVCKCDVVPVSIYSKKGKGPFKRITIRFGEPIKFSQLNLGEHPRKSDYMSAADYIMKKIITQWGKGNERD